MYVTCVQLRDNRQLSVVPFFHSVKGTTVSKETFESLLSAVLALCCYAAGGVCGCIDATNHETHKWQQECIKRDVADYDTKTGKWQWKCERVNE